MALDESVHDDDEVVTEEGFKLVYQPEIKNYLTNLRIDFKPGRFGGFVVKKANSWC